MRWRQFTVLYRQFLFRVVDLDVLSAHALGDANKLLGQFAGLLIFVSAVASLPAVLSNSLSFGAALVTQHFLIATTMLAVGLIAVLSWDTACPDRRDLFVLAPLPVRDRTMMLAKIAAVATTLGLTVALLHSVLGLAWPMAFAARAEPATVPSLRFDPTPEPLAAHDIKTAIDRDLPEAVRNRAGMAIGVLKRGERRVFSYGEARPDSLFEIGSISKTFTGLILARMTAQGKVRLDEPVRELLPRGTADKPSGREITLRDLATHRSGLPRMPANFRPADWSNPYADYDKRKLYAYLGRRGLQRQTGSGFRYSNLGVGLLGQALAERAGKRYEALLREHIAGPLGLRDTVVELSEEQQARFLQGRDGKLQPVRAWDLDALAGAGAIRSTAADMLTYLEANLRAVGPPPLTWMYKSETGSYAHGGATAGFTSYAFFNRRCDCAAVVLTNTGPSVIASPEMIGEYIRQRFSGEPAISLDTVTVPVVPGFAGVIRSYFAYWFTMLAAGLFAGCAVLTLQGVAAQLLPRRWFLRASGYLQLAAFCVIICAYFLQPGLGGLTDLGAGSLWRVFHWTPSYWFLGMYRQLSGSMHPVLDPLAARAWIGLLLSLCGSAASYLLFYWRTLPKIAEEPDIAPGTRGLSWLPKFGDPVHTAIAQFSIRSLTRSRQHRLILAFYLGVGLAITSLLMKDPATRRQFEEAGVANPWSEASIPLWASTLIMMVLAVTGVRVLFSMPLDLRANWIFRLTGAAVAPSATRRALLMLSVAPVWVVAAGVCWPLWPSRETAIHLTALGLAGAIAGEVALLGFRKIPFACSYLPGTSRVHLVFLAAIALLHLAIQGTLIERQLLEDTGDAALMLAALVAIWIVARIAGRGVRRELTFEQEEAPVVQRLGLDRDGVVAVGSQS